MLVSCIMPTYNRRHLLPLALACYQAQDWQDKELVVIDDGDTAVEDLFAGVPNVVYMRHRGGKMIVGDKVNLCCEQARGEIIVTWDDDDWYAPTRISEQVRMLTEAPGKVMSGYHTILFHDGARVWKYIGPSNYATGTSQVYLRDFWQRRRMTSKNVGYDGDIWRDALQDGGVATADGSQMIVARIHTQNVSGPRRHLGGEMWPEVSVRELPARYLSDLAAL